ncbi:olfactomedin-like isoform X2 [Rhineura floridana]|uniref:olfactomedin-like isoform X2 n=1 Tax=Rhineura floridana TaxID=261503 RepID=UPI002AC81884|nr:olfactomedin-like isoform X2 [Rhineura floridana]
MVVADHIIFHDAPIARDSGSNECVCSIELPDTTFPSHIIDILDASYKNLTHLSEQEIEKLIKIQIDITTYNKTLEDIVDRIRQIEMDGIKDETDYIDITRKIDQLKKIAEDLTVVLNRTDLGLQGLLDKVNNVSSMVWQLESFDENNVLVTHREMAILRKQLTNCEEAAGNPNFGFPSAGVMAPEFGKCDNKVLVNISKPFIVKLNWRGFSYKYGAWGKDFAVGTKNPETYWVAPLNTDERLMETYRLYNTYADLLLYRNQIEKSLSQYVGLTWNYIHCGQGSGTILYNGNFYYNCYNSRSLCKMNVATNEIKRKNIDGAVFNNWYSYNGINWQDFDFAGDEKGLWLIYSSERSKGKVIIGQLDPNTMNITKSWQTSLYKPTATGTFMICGVLYAIKRVSAHKEQVFYKYDTNTATEGALDISLEKLSDTPQSISYNPNDHKLYMYNDGYLVTYDVLFQRIPRRAKRSMAHKTEQNAVIAISKAYFSL